MKMQLSKRLGVAHVRDTVKQLVSGDIDFAQAMDELQVGKTRLYELKASFLSARAAGGSGHMGSRDFRRRPCAAVA